MTPKRRGAAGMALFALQSARNLGLQGAIVSVMDNPAQLGRSASPVTEWALDPTVTFLNHGSFGACLRAILEVQRGWRDKVEANPVRMLSRDLEDLLDWSRSEIGGFVGANADDIALMPNATAGINTVLRSLRWKPGDEVLATDHAYNASLNALRFAAGASSAKVVVARIPFPIESPDQAFDAIMAAVTPNTRLAMIEHVTSPTSLVLPIERLVPALAEKGVDVLVDGAHGPGMVPIRMADLAPAYYAGTTHKWVCAPKGSAFLYVRRDRQGFIKPLAISNGASDPRTDRSRFRLDFDWTGTFDPTAWLTIPAAIDGLGEMLPGGWPALIGSNRALMISAREMLAEALHTAVQSPDSMTGSMASLRLPGGPWSRAEAIRRKDMIEGALRGRRFEVPLITWPSPWLVDSGDLPESTEFDLLVRISAHAYNYLGQYERLASILAGFAGVNRPPG
jgi:isopenicillin-N epimerase